MSAQPIDPIPAVTGDLAEDTLPTQDDDPDCLCLDSFATARTTSPLGDSRPDLAADDDDGDPDHAEPPTRWSGRRSPQTPLKTAQDPKGSPGGSV